MKNIYTNLETQFNKVFRHVKTGSFKTRERYAKAFKRFMVYLAKEYRLQCFIAYYRKEFTENQITFHGLRHTYAREKYNEFIGIGKNEKEARRMVSELLGYHRDDVTRIYIRSTQIY